MPTDRDEDEFFRKFFEEKMAPLTLEERRAWFLRLAARLGLEAEIVEPSKPKPEAEEPK